MKANPKTVALYLGMITFAVITFGVISSYGATNLHAPKSIGGTYVLDTAFAPDCFSEPPLLVVGQSGSYLNADIVPADAKKNVLTRALKGNGFFHGQLIDGKLHLEGNAKLGSCKEKQPMSLVATSNDGLVQGTMSIKGQSMPLTGKKNLPPK
ncbi:MAG: hypothetical protein H7Y37_08440 [Anaerolineae bacterium]|nr:hypothetical protein [Gloeobacterales cyanobacterium ES-bin-313]